MTPSTKTCLALLLLAFCAHVSAYAVSNDDEVVADEIATPISAVENLVIEQFAKMVTKATAMEKTITGYPCGAGTTYTEVNILDDPKSNIFCTGPPLVTGSSVDYLVSRQLTAAWANDTTCIWRMTFCPVGYDQTLVTFQQQGSQYIVCNTAASPQCFRMAISGGTDYGQYFTRSSTTTLVSLLNTYNSGSTNYYLDNTVLMSLSTTAYSFRTCALGTYGISTC